MNNVTVGIIGYGKMGRIRAETLDAAGSAKLRAIVEPHPVELPEGVERLPTPDAMLENPEIDAVFICTPNYLNKPLTVAALNAGKHVFCEKPPAFNAAGVREIQRVEKRSGRRLMYGFNHRHHTSIRHMKHLVEGGDYGRILWMRGRYGKSVDSSFLEGWRSKKQLAGGGIMLDQGIHMLDLFLYLAGPFDEIHAFVSNLYWQLEDIEDNVFAILRNSKTGLVASLHSTMTQWRHLFALEVFLEKGYLVLNGLKTSSGAYGHEILSIANNRSTAPAATWEDEERITYETDTSWRTEVEHFLQAIREDRPIEIGTSADALELMRILDRIYRNK